MESNPKDAISIEKRINLKKALEREFLTESIPGIVIWLLAAVLVCIEIIIVENILFAALMGVVIAVSAFLVTRILINSLYFYFMIKRDRFTVVTDKLYRLGVGENHVRRRENRPDKEIDNNPSSDVYHFCVYGSFIPKVKDQRVCFPGDVFYLVILNNKKKTIVKALKTI